MIYTYKLFIVLFTVTECILNLLDPSTDWALIIFIDLMSTNILLAMLGFPVSQKRHAVSCLYLSGLFFIIKNLIFFCDELHLQIIASISPKIICREYISPVGYFFFKFRNRPKCRQKPYHMLFSCVNHAIVTLYFLYNQGVLLGIIVF